MKLRGTITGKIEHEKALYDSGFQVESRINPGPTEDNVLRDWKGWITQENFETNLEPLWGMFIWDLAADEGDITETDLEQ